MALNGGAVTIVSEFGETGIKSESIVINSGASLEIQGANKLLGNVRVNQGGQLKMTGQNSAIGGNIVNNGLFTVSAFATFSGTFLNDTTGSLTLGSANMILDSNLTNRGALNVSEVTTFRNMVNSGTITLASPSQTSNGAQGTIFVNLENSGNLVVSVNDVLFTGGLTNSGEIVVSVSGIRFTDMVDENGELRFVNSGNLTLQTATLAGEYIDVRNSGTIYSEKNISFGLVENMEGGTIEMGSTTGHLHFVGDLLNEGTISGQGPVTIYGSATGSGSFDVRGDFGVVTYNYLNGADANGNVVAGQKGALIDIDGYLRLNGHIYADPYANQRPEYDAAKDCWVDAEG